MKASGAMLLVVLGWLGPPPARAQEDAWPADSFLVQVTRLVTEGQGDSARALVRMRLAQLSSADSSYAGALYAAGVVADRADSALWYFRRVSIEYSGSRWAAFALVRLAQFAYASGDFNAALGAAQRVLDDYPGAPVRAAAAYWAGRAQLELHDLAGACGHLQQADAEAGSDVETANRARFYLQRCRSVGPPPAESTAAQAGGAFSVQVAAVRSAAAADEVMRALAGSGYEPRVVREADGLFKVRVGRFRTRAEAQRLAQELRRKVGGSPFVVEEAQQP
jgi:tetratricopeptide (TPR) repeat protein